MQDSEYMENLLARTNRAQNVRARPMIIKNVAGAGT